MMKIADIRITEAVWPKDRAPIARLMREYVEALDADISFQDFEAEHAGLPGKYARPKGVVLIGWTADEAVGIVAYRPFERRICEMKRLYVLPRFRGTGLGRLLVEELVRDARSHGYRRMVLDILPSMRPGRPSIARWVFSRSPLTTTIRSRASFIWPSTCKHPASRTACRDVKRCRTPAAVQTA
jgi:putative acetyltransferase